jgi:phosphatidylserine/phosphatidylglycerophosphate/cardiolipin synthase-like enzyme
MKEWFSYFKLFILAFILFNSFTITSAFAEASYFDIRTSYSVCFTPGDNCTKYVVNNLNHAQQSILVQAYNFTSAPIAKALVSAKERGVDVKVILDKSQTSKRYTIANYLAHHNIPVWIDNKPAIAHNKVMILDGKMVSTGSFNFTKAANNKNAENIISIKDKKLAEIYTDYWLERQKVSYYLIA